MKLIMILALILALMALVTAQECNLPCNRRIEYLCGRTVRNGSEIECTFRNPCAMDRHGCEKREVWRKTSTGRCTRDSDACGR
ncbi:uncharacterized protein LOC108154411 [Drosophila miranda]|uniref:Vasotab n=1 Tax=Drosophila pseudoobscura pseudoobscura TaxID=46245 RepID=A0A6I8VAC3_DROPS|nr:uncharacterized protein LOC26532915 [Drosophila pseudoobscura]XP_017140172.1 uncharacterized protein LOC108154411 [Drosophila miranda]XP_033232615.1 uncharacterized protein LOC26532915 [Drosophila pseudoobscura]